MAILSKLVVETTSLLVLGGKVVVGPGTEGLDARVRVVGEEDELGRVASLEGEEVGEETYGGVAGEGEFGDGATGD
jgi:hypothetical protein